MTGPDPLFAPRVPDVEVTRACRSVTRLITDAVAHAIVARQVTTVGNLHLDIADGPVGRFLRTGEVPREPTRLIWRPLYGGASLPDDQQCRANALASYLDHHAGRGPIPGWPSPKDLRHA